MKHVEINHHLISKKIETNTIALRYVPSQQVAYILKALHRTNLGCIILKLDMPNVTVILVQGMLSVAACPLHARPFML